MINKLFTISIFFLVINIIQPAALEIDAVFRIENMDYKNDRLVTENTFSGNDLFWGLSLSARQNLSDNILLKSGFYNDAILRNTFSSLLTYNHQYFSIGVGPFFGIFNDTAAILKSGISTNLRLELPGIIYILFNSDNSIGGQLSDSGDYIQERSNISFGYYVRNAICSLNIDNKKFIQKKDNYEIVDSLTDYSFKADIFSKYSPYRILFSLSYQILSKGYIESDVTTRHTIKTIILGGGTELKITEALVTMLNLEGSLFTIGSDELQGLANPGPAGHLFRAYAGIKINFDKIRQVRSF